MRKQKGEEWTSFVTTVTGSSVRYVSWEALRYRKTEGREIAKVGRGILRNLSNRPMLVSCFTSYSH